LKSVTENNRITAARIAYESPITCCHGDQVSPLLSMPFISQCGAAARMTMPTAATVIPALSRNRQLISRRASMAGSAHTQ
jgi:hypothetical protein